MTSKHHHKNRDEDAILTWRMPPWALWVSRGALPLIGIALFLWMRSFFPSQEYSSRDHGPGAYALGLLWFPVVLLWAGWVAEFTCFEKHIYMGSVLATRGWISWDDVVSIRRWAGLFVTLRTTKGLYHLIGVPKPVLDRLVAILHETSSAQIMGFN
jgi:hypothetical protein